MADITMMIMALAYFRYVFATEPSTSKKEEAAANAPSQLEDVAFTHGHGVPPFKPNNSCFPLDFKGGGKLKGIIRVFRWPRKDGYEQLGDVPDDNDDIASARMRVRSAPEKYGFKRGTSKPRSLQTIC
ncbi:hypothetical protein WOLCODRAFT_166166 [Wolfiporia cocos MD-104 SS10]|uniref:Uncharacterized protein n=1 Tax=Wolfiporia cocos (strain MD-104) TaxID=742152 RepID=A0A2H3IZ48_WOLCO|nr:hypothetical protein WOLCODRAFT_166166 [Wolfiporia cocos MD-104 SS10]